MADALENIANLAVTTLVAIITLGCVIGLGRIAVALLELILSLT